MNRKIVLSMFGAAALMTFGLQVEARATEINATVAASADGARYNADQVNALVEKYEAKGLHQVGPVIQSYVAAGVPQGDLELMLGAAYAFSLAHGDDVRFTAYEVSEAFTGSYDSLKELDRKYNFMSAADHKRMLSIAHDEGIGAARDVARDSLRQMVRRVAAAM